MAGAYLISLTHLYLGFNQIEALPEQIGNLSTLTLLHLENNKLEGVPRSFVMLDKVTELSLAHNLFLEIPKELTKLAGLVRLDLSHQGDGSLLEELPPDFRSLSRLEELRLSGNSFKFLPESILPDASSAGFVNLRVLAMDNNPVVMVDEDIAVCSKLERLLLHGTRIRTLNKSITYMYALQELWIADTEMRKLDPALAQLRSLRKIVLAHEDQLENFADIRRLIRGEIWSFLRPGEPPPPPPPLPRTNRTSLVPPPVLTGQVSCLRPGEGEVATLSALAKFEEAEHRTRRRRDALARANGTYESRGNGSSDDDEDGGAPASPRGEAPAPRALSETQLSFDVRDMTGGLGSSEQSRARRSMVSFGDGT